MFKSKCCVSQEKTLRMVNISRCKQVNYVKRWRYKQFPPELDLFVPNVFFNLSKSEITNYQNERKSQRIPKYVVSLFSPRSTISWLLLENLVYDLCPEYVVSLFFEKNSNHCYRANPNAIIIHVTKVISNDLFKQNKTFISEQARFLVPLCI